MRLKPAYIVVIVIVAVVFAYLLLRPFLGKTDKSEQAAAQTPAAAAAAANAPPLVETTLTPQIMHPYMVDVRGRTQAARTVEVRSETAGDVASTPILQGTFVRQGTVLCRLAVDARSASLDEAMANMKSKKLQMQASASLAAKGFRSPTQVLTDQAALDAATAGVRAAQVALDQVNIRAPFTGVFDPLLIVGDVPETEAGKVHVGATATAKLVSGEAISGRVRFVAHDADPATRTYRVEITSANAGNRVRSGLSADVQIGAGVGPAHLVPVSALVLDAAGQQGVRYVMADGVVAFAPVTVLDETPSGVWVSGLAGPTRVITVGQSYVSQGQKVRVAAR